MTEEYKHITVTAAEEDDEVVVAGAPQEAPQAVAPTEPREQRKPGKSREDSYRETTLDDLKGSPAPLAQKIVIIAAIICIIGALVYYFVAMR